MLVCVIATYDDADCLPRAIDSAWRAGCDDVVVFDSPWAGFTPEATETQAEKRTRMFRECGAGPGDLVLSLDADEEVEGVFPELELAHHTVIRQNTGPNDLPGIRGEWPMGDGGIVPFPLLKVFKWSPQLRCVVGVSYDDEHGRILPYNGDGTSRLPLVKGVQILHHAGERTAERKARKAAYYLWDHPHRVGI